MHGSNNAPSECSIDISNRESVDARMLKPTITDIPVRHNRPQGLNEEILSLVPSEMPPNMTNLDLTGGRLDHEIDLLVARETHLAKSEEQRSVAAPTPGVTSLVPGNHHN